MELWGIYGARSECDDADEDEVERVKLLVMARRMAQHDDAGEQDDEARSAEAKSRAAAQFGG